MAAFAFKVFRGETKVMIKSVLKAASCAAALAMLAGGAFAADSLKQSTDWQTSGHDLGGQRYSPLTQITQNNVARLQPAWSIHLTMSPV